MLKIDNNKTMRIGLVLSSTPAYSETFFNSKIKGLQEHGYSVVLLTQTRRKDFDLCPVITAPKVYKNPVLQTLSMVGVILRLLIQPKSLIKYIRLEKQLNTSTKRLLKKIYLHSHILNQKIDWLHYGYATKAIESEFLAKAIGAKLAVSFRGFDINVYPIKHPKCYDLLWKEVDKVHSISNDLMQKAYGIGLSKKKPYNIITPAVNLSHLNALKGSKINHKNPQIVTVARLNWIKGLDHALNTMKILKDNNFDFEYHIIGSGSPTEIERYTFQIHQNQLQNHVFLHGKLSHKKVLTILNSADLYIQTSIQEGFCNAVLEAQALGLLCIVTDAGALPENIIDKKTGWIVPKRQPKLLANKIIEVIGLPEAEQKIIQNQAVKHVEKNFNIEKQQDAFAEFYKYPKE